MIRKALNKNLIINGGQLCESFDELQGWTKNGNGNIEIDTINYQTGEGSLKLTTNDAGGLRVIKNIDYNNELGFKQNIKLLIPDFNSINSINIYFGNSDMSTYFVKSFYQSDLDYIKNSWIEFQINNPDWITHGEAIWNNSITNIMIGLYPKTGKTASISLDSIKTNVKKISTFSITLDDNTGELIPAINSMTDRKIKSVLYVNPANFDVDPPGENRYMTTNEIIETHENGHLIANHTIDHSDLTTQSLSDARLKIEECITSLDEIGCEDGAYHLAAPYNHYNEDVVSMCLDVGIKSFRAPAGYNNCGAQSMLQLRGVGVVDDVNIMKSFVDYIKKYQMNCTLIMHGITSSTLSGRVHQTVWDEFLDYLLKSKVWIGTPDQIIKWINSPRRNRA